MDSKRVSVLRIAGISAAAHAVIGTVGMWTVLGVVLIAHTTSRNTVSDALTSSTDEMLFLILLTFPILFAMTGFVLGAAACRFRNFYVAHCGTHIPDRSARYSEDKEKEKRVSVAA